MVHINPDLDWYTAVSEKKGVRPRCPFASVQRCPRFYQSLSLLGHAGSTEIEPKEDKRLLENWKKSDLWPVTDEQATSITGKPGDPYSFSNFCSEVAYERFGFFASFLGHYADEIDRENAHKSLIKEGALRGDWRWTWAFASPMHYTECPLYSPLDLDASRSGKQEDKDAPGNVLQTILRTIWLWSPFWRKVVIVIIVIALVAFAFWSSLPDRTKERVLDTFTGQPMRKDKSSKEAKPWLFLNAPILNTIVMETEAILVGNISDEGGDPKNLEVWFQYGKTRDCSLESTHLMLSGTNIFSVLIDNLDPCTKYYYRAVGKNIAGTSYGEIKTLTTECPPKP